MLGRKTLLKDLALTKLDVSFSNVKIYHLLIVMELQTPILVSGTKKTKRI